MQILCYNLINAEQKTTWENTLKSYNQENYVKIEFNFKNRGK